MMNVSRGNAEDLTGTTALVTSVFGFVLFIPNISVSIFLLRVLFTLAKYSDKYNMTMQFLFVCLNDTISGFVIIIIGLVKVRDYISAAVCAYSILFSEVLQFMSNETLAMICAQRYYSAINIRKVTGKNKSKFPFVLVSLNLAVAVIMMTSFIANLSLKTIEKGYVYHCAFDNFKVKNEHILSSVLFVLLFVLLIVPNILCGMTIYKLRSELKVAVQQTEGTTGNSSKVTTDSQVQQAVKLRHRKATMSIFLIILGFNVSYFPTIFTYTLLSALHVQISFLVERLLYLTLFANSLINPVIIATRVQEIRLVIGNGFQCLKAKVLSIL